MKQAFKVDKERWIEEEKKQMEEDIRCHSQWQLLSKDEIVDKQQVDTYVRMNTILDKKGKTIKNLRRNSPDGRDTCCSRDAQCSEQSSREGSELRRRALLWHQVLSEDNRRHLRSF